jgi:hypothetical protein
VTDTLPTSARCLRRLFAAAMVIALSPLAPIAADQTVTASAPALKSLFLYNFAKLTEWPVDALPPGEPLLLCVVNDRAVAAQLEALTKGRSEGGRMLAVSSMNPDSLSLSSCRLLFSSGLDPARSAALLEAVNGRPMLTVGDGEAFARAGGMVGLFVEGGTLRFAVNTEAAQRAHLQLSSKLLSLAKIVKEDRHGKR